MYNTHSKGTALIPPVMIERRVAGRSSCRGLLVLVLYIAAVVLPNLLWHSYGCIGRAMHLQITDSAGAAARESNSIPQHTVDPYTDTTLEPKVLSVSSGQGVGSAIVFIIRALRYMELMAPGEVLNVDLSAAANITGVFLEEYVVLCQADTQRVRCLRDSSLHKTYTEMFMNKDVDAVHMATPFTRRHALNQQLYAKYLSFKEAVREQVVASIDENVADVSIMVRRGDKLTLEKDLKMAPLDLYVNRIAELRAKRVFVATDDYTMVEELQKTMPGVRFLTACPPTERGFFLDQASKWGRDEIKQHLDKFAKEIQALIAAPFAVLDMNSNAFAVALYGRNRHALRTLLPMSNDTPPQSSNYYKRMALK